MRAFGVLALLVLSLHTCRGRIELGPNGKYILIAPFTDAEHIQACPSLDIRVCPVLVVDSPVLVVNGPAENGIHIRSKASLSEIEQERQATVPFKIYNLKDDNVQKRYGEITETFDIKVSFTFTEGVLFFAQQDYFSCNVTIVAETANVLGRVAGPDGETFSITSSAQKINCLLEKLYFQSSQTELSSEAMLARFGTLPSLKIRIENAVSSSDLDISFEISTLIYYQKIVTPVLVDTCPQVTYNAPAPPLEWERSDLTSVAAYRGQQCLTAPISSLGASETTRCRQTADGSGSTICFSCGSSQSTFLYVFEDTTVALQLADLAFTDVNSIYAIVAMSFVLSFQGSNDPINDARTEFEAVGSRHTAFCAGCTEERPDQRLWKYCAKKTQSVSLTAGVFEDCAARTADAFNAPWVPQSNTWLTSYNIVVRKTTTRASMCIPSPQAPECVDCGQTADQVGATRYCPCTNGLCFALWGLRSSSSGVWFDAATGARKARLWFDAVDRGKENEQAHSLQDGFFDLTFLRRSAPEDTIWDATGWMYARPSANSTLEWFKVAPMIVEEARYDTASQELTVVRAVSDPGLNKQMRLSVRTRFGRVNVPSAPTATRASDQELAVSANLRDANNALARVEYVLNTPANYNSQTNRSGRVDPPDLLTVSLDKSVPNAGLDDVYGVGQTSVAEFPVHVIAVNDPPVIVAPALAQAVENQIASVPGVSVEDPDVDEVLLTEVGVPPSGVCPLKTGEVEHVMSISLSTRNGSVFVNTTGVKEFRNVTVIASNGIALTIPQPSMRIMRLLMESYGTIPCGLDDWLLCVDIGTEADPRGRRRDIVFVGARALSFAAAKPCVNHALRHLRYRGQQDYNNNVPAAPPSDRRGCRKSEDDNVVGERIFITVSDNGFTGCQSGTRLTDSAEIEMSVLSVTQSLLVTAPVVAMAVEDQRLAFTPHRCKDAADFPLQQRRCGAIQVLSRDNGDLSLLERTFRMTLAITKGLMTLGKTGGLTFLAGSNGQMTSGADATEIVFDGRLCSCNEALETLSVMMEPDFNTDQAVLVDGAFRNESVLITIFIEQLPDPVSGAPGGDSASHQVPVRVRGTDDGPSLALFFPPQTRRADHAPLEIASAFADIYICGGSVPCQCPASALACIEVDDPDSCEAKWRSQLACDSFAGPLRSDARISARTRHGSLWFFPMADMACDPTAALGDPRACADSTRTVTQAALDKISLAEAGTMLRAVDVVAPLPQLQGGVLRVWASLDRYGNDTLEVTVRGGQPLPGVVQEGAAPVKLELRATACASQAKALCIGAGDTGTRGDGIRGTSLPGYGVVLVGLVVAIALGLTVLCSQHGIGRLEYGAVASESAAKQDAVADLGHKMQQVSSNAQDTHWVQVADNRDRTYWYRSDTRETTWRDPTAPMQGSRLQLLLEEDSMIQSYDARPGDDSSFRQPSGAYPSPPGVPIRRRSRSRSIPRSRSRSPVQFGTRFDDEEIEISDNPAPSHEELGLTGLDNAKVTGMLLTRSEWMDAEDNANGVSGVQSEKIPLGSRVLPD